ncbi:MAG: glycosyl hydrolase-related protein [Clostridiales bacterium]|nr:glycosyl hydrolase-related protein [Clostridiales bacterium]
MLNKEQDEIELLKEPISLGLFKYTGSKDWPAWEMNFKEANKEADRIPNVVTVTVLEQGPARVTFKVIQQDGKSTFLNIITLTDGCDIVEVYSEIEWRSLRTLAKNKFSFTAQNEKATFDLALGAVERGNMTEELFEVPTQNWADITDKSGEYGISVLSECKYGWDKFSNNTLRMTVLHTPKKNYRIDSMQSMMDLGLNRYSFAIYSHEGAVGADTQLETKKFITPMTAYICSKHQGKLKTEYSFGSVSDNDVIIRAIKKAEDSDEIIVRLGEGGKKSVDNFTLTLGEGIESAREIYASEEPLGEAVVKDGKLVTDFEPYQIRSFALKLKPSPVSGIKAESTPIDLEYDMNIITKQGDTADLEYTIPYEIMPDTVTSNGVTFKINKDAPNTLIANGQFFTVPDDADKAVLLCASYGSDTDAEFMVGDTSVIKRINSCFERFAAWDLYDFNETAYIKKGKLAFEATHSHKDGKDAYTKGMYFYLVELDTSKDKKIMLPIDENIIIISTSSVKCEPCSLASPVYDEVEKREFNFALSFPQLIQYVYNKCVWQLNDKDNFIKDNNRGRHDD